MASQQQTHSISNYLLRLYRNEISQPKTIKQLHAWYKQNQFVWQESQIIDLIYSVPIDDLQKYLSDNKNVIDNFILLGQNYLKCVLLKLSSNQELSLKMLITDYRYSAIAKRWNNFFFNHDCERNWNSIKLLMEVDMDLFILFAQKGIVKLIKEFKEKRSTKMNLCIAFMYKVLQSVRQRKQYMPMLLNAEDIINIIIIYQSELQYGYDPDLLTIVNHNQKQLEELMIDIVNTLNTQLYGCPKYHHRSLAILLKSLLTRMDSNWLSSNIALWYGPVSKICRFTVEDWVNLFDRHGEYSKFSMKQLLLMSKIFDTRSWWNQPRPSYVPLRASNTFKTYIGSSLKGQR